MSYSRPRKTKPSAVMGMLIQVDTHGNVVHLVEKNGMVVCRCSFHPEDVMLVEKVPMTNIKASTLCKGSVERYKQLCQ